MNTAMNAAMNAAIDSVPAQIPESAIAPFREFSRLRAAAIGGPGPPTPHPCREGHSGIPPAAGM
ncbi:hypothetical protein H7827_17605 [Streptomyces sp. JH002]|uniref:hypothetical protein n=1 Tax=Streptomyces sp. JH002 TaxID=2763259 RepID=UPI003D80227B